LFTIPGDEYLPLKEEHSEAISEMVCNPHSRAVKMREECERQDIDSERLKLLLLRRSGHVDDKHKLLFCSSAKTGSSTFRSYLWKLNVPDTTSDAAPVNSLFRNMTGIRFIRELSVTELDRVMKSYFKVLVVRHPFDRLVSAWEHLLSKPNRSHVIRGRVLEVIDEYVKRKDPSRDHDFDHATETLTFQQFLELICERYHSGFMNIHWATYSDNCQPCHVKYDHVFRLETLSRDMDILYNHLRSINMSAPVPVITHAHKIRQLDNTKKMGAISENYKYISAETIQCLQRLYGRDMNLFGYRWQDGKASCLWPGLNCC
jgi:chondroitin 4-sulfotransferase 11/chondroitin 4-sulfotransferase 13